MSIIRRLRLASARFVPIAELERAAAATDPRGFLDLHPAPAIFDEVQYAPAVGLSSGR
jgi:hypothetical protein